MKKIPLILFLITLLTLLTACSATSAQNDVQPSATPTEDCGCSLEDILATPTGGIVAQGPAAPSVDLVTPMPLASYQGQWKVYENTQYGFSFEYPAVYESADFSFCAVRPASEAPQGSQFSLSLGSRTTLMILAADGQDLASIVEAYRSELASQNVQFEAIGERTIGGVPALVLPYRSAEDAAGAQTVFFLRTGVLYRIQTGTPSACDVPVINLVEADAYNRMLDTFSFSQ